MKIKTVIQFILTFLVILIFAYAFPNSLQPFESFAPKGKFTGVVQKSSEKSQGLEQYIGKDASKYSKELSFAKIKKDNGKIVQIIVSKETDKTNPFVIGESIGNINEKFQMQTTISVQDKTEIAHIELSETQINYSPIYSFSNKLFAILYFSNKTGKLEKIIYLDANELLKMKEYLLV